MRDHPAVQQTGRVNIFLDEPLHRQLKVVAAMEGKTLQELVAELVDEQVAEDKTLVRRLIG
ncbi:MAG: hypothetical protein GXP63_01815 [DPANN group archaeon]|nr:hypothetical protein [DPANN group archaeon]